MKIVRPTLLLDKEICLRNIDRMIGKARANRLTFRPHFKTHQSLEIGRWFRERGVTCITVSSVRMAQYFASDNWTDITIAFPVNILEIDEINQLASKIKLNLLVENKESITFLQKFLRYPVGIFLKIDTGYNRTGIPAGRTSQIDQLLVLLKDSPLMEFKGFLTHNGQTYHAKTIHDIYNIHFESLLKLRSLKNRYKKEWPNLILSTGDTPSCSICSDFTDIDEIRPGNFVFYDVMQMKLGACSLQDIAVRMACPVVSVHPSRNEVVIYGGAVHFSKDWITNIDGKPLYGRIIIRKEGKEILLDEKSYLSSLSQEHGILKVSPRDLQYFKSGQVVEIIPAHSCLTANLMKEYYCDALKIAKSMPIS